MSAINRLSNCETVQDFNIFSQQLKSDNESSGRSFVLIDENGGNLRSYTMNQIVHRLKKCVKNSALDLGAPVNDDLWRTSRNQLRNYTSEALNTINELNASANETSEGRCLLRLRQKLGNVWYTITHFGFDKDKTLNKLQRNYPDALQTVTKQIFDKFSDMKRLERDCQYDNFIEGFERSYLKKGSFLSEALEDPETQSIIFKSKKLSRIFTMYAQINHIDSFSSAHIDFVSHKMVKSAQKYKDRAETSSEAFNALEKGMYVLMEAKFQKVGLVFADALTNPILFNNDRLRPAIVAYAKDFLIYDTLSHHLEFIAQKIVNKADELVIESEGSVRSLANSLYCAFLNEDASLRACLTAFFGCSRMDSYPIKRNDRRLRILFLDPRLREAVLEFADRTNIRGRHLVTSYQNMIAEVLVKNAGGLIIESNGSLDDLATALITKCKINGFSASATVFNRVLFADDRLRPALVYYARQNHLEGFSDYHLEFIGNRIVANEDHYKGLFAGRPAIQLAKHLESELAKEGYSLEDVLKRVVPPNKYLQIPLFVVKHHLMTSPLIISNFIRPSLVCFARERHLDEFLNRHLAFLVQEIIEEKDNLKSQSINLSHLIKNMKNQLGKESRSIDEIFNNDNLVNILINADDTFKCALKDYCQRHPMVRSMETNQEDFEEKAKLAAAQLGKEHGEIKCHLADKLGLEAIRKLGNSGRLRRAVLDYLRKNHSDKNAHSDPELIRDATALIELIKFKNYELYDDAYKYYSS